MYQASKFWVIAWVCVVSCLSLQAQTKISLDEGWKFHFGNAANPEKDFNYSIATLFAKSSAGATTTPVDIGFNDSTWRTLNVPHDWAVELPFTYNDNFDVESHGYKPVGGLYPETSIGWYRKQFKVARADSGQRFQLQFDGIFRNASIWVNGFFVGNNASGYIGVNYDVTDYINFDKPNTITVRVDATQYEGWFYEGAGIYRHAWLNQYNNVHFTDGGVYARATVQGNVAQILVAATVANNALTATNCAVTTYITTRDGQKLAETKPAPLALASNTSATVQQKLTVTNPVLWDLDNPYLYRIVTVIKSADSILAQQTTRFGVRTFRFDAAEGFFLNGKHLKIQGTNNHQDHAGIGTALPDYMNEYRIRLLKNMGANAYRTSHGAPTPELLDACDSLGMLVLDEQRLLNSSPEYMSQIERMILRDRNHPSVFLWSIGNEEGWIQTTTYGKRIAQTLIAKQQQLDPSRTCTYAADLANVFKGVNEVIPVRGFNYRQFGVADYHKDHPNQPVIGTEMGSTVSTRGIYAKDSIHAYLPDQDITAPWWASRAETWWKLAAENNYWQGGFVWTGFDYRGEPTPYKWPNISSHFGIMDACGFPKNLYYFYQSWWTDKDVLHIAPHWNWPDKLGKTIDVWVNSNADSVELLLNGHSLGIKNMPRNGHLQWDVTYHPGKLEAIGYKKGKRINAKIETTGQVAEVVVTPSKTTLLADGKDVSVLDISLVDKDGREVPNANNLVQFTITGNAQIVGVGNGDPSCHEPDKCTPGAWQRSAFNGKCQVIVQAGKTAGTIHVGAKAAGLNAGVTDIVTVSSEKVTTVGAQ